MYAHEKKSVFLWIRPLIKFYIPIRKTAANRVRVESKGCWCSLDTNVSKLRFHKLQMESWSQIRSTINNISIKIGQSGFGNREKNGKATCLQQRSQLILHFIKKKKIKPSIDRSMDGSMDGSAWQSWQTHGASFSAQRGRNQTTSRLRSVTWSENTDRTLSELPGFVQLQVWVSRRPSGTLLTGWELIKGPLTWNSAGALKQTPQKTKPTDYFSATNLLLFFFLALFNWTLACWSHTNKKS